MLKNQASVHATHVIGNDDFSRNQWCSRLSCSRHELEAAILSVGPSAPAVLACLRRRRRLKAGPVASAVSALKRLMGLAVSAKP